jgi:hypothetical protein
MTDDRMARVPADDLDARLARYLDWESAQLHGTPSGEDIALRITGRAAQRRWVGSAGLAWAILALALLGAALAFVVSGGSNLLTVLPSASPQGSSGESGPSAVPTASPTIRPIVAGTCGTGRTVITAAPSGAPVPEEATPLRAPRGTRVAIALEDQPTASPPTGGSIVVVGPEVGSVRVVATFAGQGIMRDGGVGIFAWSANGESLLVYAGSDSTLSADDICGNLWIVQADGSAVIRLTDNGPAEAIDQAAFSPSSESVAYVQANTLHVLRLTGGEQTIPIGQCSYYGSHRLHWAPDEQKVLLVCDREVVVLDQDTGTARRLPVPANLIDAVWSPNAQSIVAVTAAEAGPVVVLDIDAADGSTVTRLQGDHIGGWNTSSGTLSPDGRWLLVRGDGDIPDSGDPTYLIDTTTGRSTRLPWPVVGDSWFWNTLGGVPVVTWLEGNDRVLAADDGKLYEVDLPQVTRTEVGSVVPNQDWAVFTTQR